jgi:hypothetical protein
MWDNEVTIESDNEDGPEYAQLSVTVDENLLTTNGEVF